MSLATVWRRSTGWHITQLAAHECGVCPPHAPASLSHIFVLTASCAFLVMVARYVGVTTAYWNQKALLNATYIPLLGSMIGCIAVTASLGHRRSKWIVLLIYAAAIWLALTVWLFASDLSLTGVLWPGTTATLGLDYPLWFALFTGLWLYVLRSSGLRMRRYAVPEPPDPFA